MKINIKEENTWKRVLEIEIPKESVENEFESVYKKYQSFSQISGFRPGKAPKDLVKEHYKEQIDKEVLENLLPKAYDEAIQKNNLLPITLPRLSEIEFAQGTPLKFKAEIEIRPEVEPKDYKGL